MEGNNTMIALYHLLFSIVASILIKASKRRNPKFIKIRLDVTFQISSLVLALLYLILNEFSFQEFLRKVLCLYLPIIHSQLGFILSIYNDLLTLFLIPVELAVIHTELENKRHHVVLAVHFLYLLFNIIIFSHKFRFSKKILEIEYSEQSFGDFVTFYLAISLFYCIIIYYSMAGVPFILLPPFMMLISFGVYSSVSTLIYIPNDFIMKLVLSFSVVLYSILAFAKNNNLVTCFTIILSASFIRTSYLMNLNVIRPLYVELIIDSDVYLAQIKRSLELVKKGNQNQIIPKEVTYNGNLFKVIKFDKLCMSDYCHHSIQISNPLFLSFIQNNRNFFFNEIILDCEINYQVFNILTRKMGDNMNISLTNRCVNLVQNSNKIFSIELDLCFVSKNSNDLLINRSCRVIKERACFRCKLLKIIKFPDSVIKIEELAFADCISLRKITFDKNSQLRSIKSKAFNNTGLRAVNFPNLVHQIGYSAFRSCKNLKRVHFPDESRMKKLFLCSFSNFDISIYTPSNISIMLDDIDLTAFKIQIIPLINNRQIVTLFKRDEQLSLKIQSS